MSTVKKINSFEFQVSSYHNNKKNNWINPETLE